MKGSFITSPVSIVNGLLDLSSKIDHNFRFEMTVYFNLFRQNIIMYHKKYCHDYCQKLFYSLSISIIVSRRRPSRLSR